MKGAALRSPFPRFIVKQSPLEDLHEKLYDLTTAFSANEFYILHRSRGVKFLPES